MAEEEAEKEYNRREETVALRKRFQELTTVLRDSADSALDASANFCHEFCQILVEHGGQWKSEEDPLPLLEMYTVAILCFAEATPFLFPECEHVTVVLEKLALSCLDFLLSLSENVPSALWEEFQSSVKVAHGILQGSGNLQLSTLLALANETGIWTNTTLCHILSNNMPDVEKVHELLAQEGPTLLDMRIKHLIKQKCVEKAAVLAKTCAEFPEFGGKKNFKQNYLVCLCETVSQQELMQEIKEIDCKDALDMICNLESEENEKGALSLCTAFFKRQLLQGDVYCAWELTLFWSKLLIRLESAQAFMDQCRLLAQLSGSVYHILLLIKVIQAEVQNEGLPVCIEMCIQALKIGVSDSEDCNTTICKTISCLLPLDLEVKRACQLTEFLVKPTVDSYYAVETLFNEPDQKLEEESLPIPNSLRCDLLLALKTQWPFDPEFWDWKTLKRHCLGLMGEEASIVSSIDKLNDSEENEGLLDADDNDFKHLDFTLSPTSEASCVEAERKKKREMKKLREKGFVSARFRNWQAYMQYCVLCDKEFLGHRIVKHALKHVQDGIFRCPICTKTFETRAVLEPHVASHVKESCKERLAAMNAKDKKLSSAEPLLTDGKQEYSQSAVKLGQNVCPTVVGTSNTNSSTAGNVKPKLSSPKRGNPVRDVENTEDCSCPVTSCQKVFKYFRNLVAHVKAHKNEEEATHFLEVQSQKAICQYCRRQFVNMTHLNDHLQMHCGEKPYFCIQLGCKCSFNSHAELLMHRKVHSEFQAQCMFPNCGRVFSEAYLLYDHEAQHYITFTCKSDNCGKIFYSLSQLNLHQKEHTKSEFAEVEGPSLESETETQSPLNVMQASNQVADVPQDSSPQNMKQTVENMLNSTHSSVEGPDCSLSYTSESSVTRDQSPARDPSVAQTNEATKTLNTACVTQPGVDSPKQINLRSCYVKLMPIPIKYDNSVFLNALKSSDAMTQSILKDKKLFCITCKQLATAPKTPDLQNGTSTNAYAQPWTQDNLENGEDNLTHICPFETCTRKYSTSKSLSRHVKNVHIEAFEEWKLSRKYKRIAEIAARKSCSDNKLSSVQTSKKRIKSSTRPIPHQYPENQQVKLQPDCTTADPIPHLSAPINAQTFGAKFCPQFEGAPNETPLNETPLLQSQMAQSWTSASFDGYNSDYSLQNHFPPMIMPDGLQQSYPLYLSHTDLLSERDLDYAPSISDDGNTLSTGNMDSHSSVMNEASKYVSSSLRVLHALNGDQTCEISQMASSEELGYMPVRQNHNSGVPSDDSDLQSVSEQNFNPYFSSYPAETCSTSVEPLLKPEKEYTVSDANPLFTSEGKSQPHFVSRICKEEPECFSVSNASITAMENEQNNDLLTQEMSPVTSEDVSCGDKSVTSPGEIMKMKKIRSSKRTKWPAIIKDGKVICCRCYREFTSTKSLGGHLSKRSQCKPLDEVDLTADLPTSFLDFLNDPDISTLPISLQRNDMHGQDPQSVLHQQSDSNVLNSSSFTDIHSPNYSLQNGHLSSGDTSESPFIAPHNQSGSSSSVPSLKILDLPETETERNCKAEITSTPSVEDGNILEIERALQRLDLVDGLTQDTLKVGTPALQNVMAVPKTTTTKSCNKPKSQIESHDLKNVLKPFRCTEDGCVYGAMTKEALFKHLVRVHEFTEEKVNELKRNPDRLSPYICHLCSKTFTRTTGLKIHYKNVHRLSREDISKLKIGRQGRKTKASNSASKDATKNLSSPQTKHFPSVQSNVTFGMSGTNIKSEPADFAGKKQCVNQVALINSVISPAADMVQKNPILISEKDLKPLQDPCHTADNPSMQGSTIDVNQEPVAGNSVPLDQHCVLEQAANVSSTHVGESMTEQIDKSKKAKPKERSEHLKKEKPHKKLVAKLESVDANDEVSLYRPYRCVHEGCVAAFSIQQNLILHYKAMHQSEILDEANENVSGDHGDGSARVHEFKCQVKECSKVVSKVTSLLKHYLLLHRCTLEKASALLSGIEVGKFQCDQSKCSAYFTCHLKYIDHIKNDHKAIRVSPDGDFESVDLTFKCEYEGCDRVYTTKSNLLRHFMKKHQTTFETIKQKQKKSEAETESAKTLGAKPNDGKENISSNKIKLKKKNSKKKEEKARNHWTSFGKPSLKSMDEASAMCTGQFPLQYPCMIKGCDSVSSTERNIVKHYTTHGLTERYIENQRSHFIFCKKNSRLRNKEGSKSDEISSDATEVGKADSEANTDPAQKADPQQKLDPTETVDPTQTTEPSQKADPQQNAEPTQMADPSQKADPQQNTEPTQMTDPQKADPVNSMVKSQDLEPKKGAPPKTEQLAFVNSTSEPVPVKRKRGRPRKSEQTLKVNPERRRGLRFSTTDSNHVPKVSGSTSNSAAHHQEQTESGVAQKLFSPLGLKASILKLFEEPPSTNTFKRKSTESDWTDKPLKRKQKNLTANSIYKHSMFLKKSEDQNMVHFRNPLKLESVNNVKIVMDGSFSNGADLLLKQLQDMRPTVILKKWLCS
ncbi:zinc finger protein 292a [Ictalurus furcatus]|uniref:zinc finger protein 292a n=1 Tax=Ictalurus furcatus TaxID=66913 RepID=UPI0023507596|nr:zinc finger protein 292a [Ictalurus furcatus]